LEDDILNTIFDSAIKNKNIIKNRQVLTIDYVPDKLLFRTKETASIAQSLSVILKKGRPSNLLIFGKPGTRPYRRMAVALAHDIPAADTNELRKKAKAVADCIAIE